jgi:hypothetical protein
MTLGVTTAKQLKETLAGFDITGVYVAPNNKGPFAASFRVQGRSSSLQVVRVFTNTCKGVAFDLDTENREHEPYWIEMPPFRLSDVLVLSRRIAGANIPYVEMKSYSSWLHLLLATGGPHLLFPKSLNC